MVENYDKRLSREEVASRLDGFLDVIKQDYSFLWDGNPSLINKYGSFPTLFGIKSEFVTNDRFNKAIPLSINLPNPSQEGFDSLGIVKNEGKFKFYLDVADIPDFAIYEKGIDVYCALEKQFDFSTESCMDDWAKGIYSNLEKILKNNFDEKLSDLKEKLKIK